MVRHCATSLLAPAPGGRGWCGPVDLIPGLGGGCQPSEGGSPGTPALPTALQGAAASCGRCSRSSAIYWKVVVRPGQHGAGPPS